MNVRVTRKRIQRERLARTLVDCPLSPDTNCVRVIVIHAEVAVKLVSYLGSH